MTSTQEVPEGSTDSITYLFYTDECCYLSTILDAVTHEILAYELSVSLKVDFVINTVDKLILEHGSVLDATQSCIVTRDVIIQATHY
ncbi:hypothetical protein MASR2M70_01360 [Bacillota bacterium]